MTKILQSVSSAPEMNAIESRSQALHRVADEQHRTAHRAARCAQPDTLTNRSVLQTGEEIRTLMRHDSACCGSPCIGTTAILRAWKNRPEESSAAMIESKGSKVPS